MSASVTDRMLLLEAALAELLRLYDWRFELAKTEKELLSPLQRKQLDADLRRYGREKKAAWEVARAVLRNAAPQAATGTVPPESSEPAVAAPQPSAKQDTSPQISHTDGAAT